MADAPPTIQPPPPAPPPVSSGDPRTWAMFCHLSALAGIIGVPFGNIIGPLIVWLVKKNEYPLVDVHGKRALNFQITATIFLLATVASAFVLSFFCVGYLLFPVAGLIFVAALVCTIIGAVKTSNGEDYKYPFSFEFVK
jgi:uncharacterized Tic20 family protein